ncbi:hypothetical protein KAR91_04630 [Candidatus Pacearchaeota archaeon]|nr:hypothetical protein [Candidatus Pacearchaeota archaeon]
MNEIQKLRELKPNISKDKLVNGGTQFIYKFKNEMGASVVCSPYSYGGDNGLLELAVLDKDGSLDYSTSVTGDTEGHLTAEKAAELLDQIEGL